MEPGGINLTGANAPIFIKAFLKGSETGLSLRAGDIIQARVTASSEGSAVLNLNGVKVPVSTGSPLSTGDLLSLVVVELKPERVVLKRLELRGAAVSSAKYSKEELATLFLKSAGFKGGELARAVAILTGDAIDTGRGLASLMSSLMQAQADGDAGFDAGLLRSMAEAIISGTGDNADSIERQIRAFIKALDSDAELIRSLAGGDADPNDLKTALLEAKAAIQGGAALETSGIFAGLRSSLEKMLDLINAAKALNLPVDAQGRDMIYLPLPIRVGDEVRTAQIRIYSGPDESGRRGIGTRYSIGFSLEMPALGRTQALLEAHEKMVSFTISFENRDALRGVDDHLQELRAALEELGYTVGRLSASELSIDGPHGSLIEEKLGTERAGIDVRV